MRNRKTYFLDLQTLLMYLNAQSCELTTELKVSGNAARGSILLKEGRIVYCLLSFQNGLQLTGEQAYKQIEACTEWQVELEQPDEKKKKFSPEQFSPRPQFAPFPATPSASTENLHYYPPLRQKRALDPALLQPLPLRERLILRSVYAMINGKRSNEEIKAQLRLSASDIDDALTRLRVLDLIE